MAPINSNVQSQTSAAKKLEAILRYNSYPYERYVEFIIALAGGRKSLPQDQSKPAPTKTGAGPIQLYWNKGAADWRCDRPSMPAACTDEAALAEADRIIAERAAKAVPVDAAVVAA